MEIINKLLKQELNHYRKLSDNSQKLLLSYTLYYFASPILSMFSNAFIWRQSRSLNLIIFFNFAYFTGLPIGYFINGKLLGRYAQNHLYAFGCITQGIIIAILMFIPIIQPSLILTYGILFGITSGFFWANKSFLTSTIVKSSARVYFSGTEQISAIVTGIIIPLFVGWFIFLGKASNVFNSVIAYRFIVIFTILILYTATRVIKDLKVEKSKVPKVTVRACKRWKTIRVSTFTLGLSNGIESILPIILVFMFIGNENSLGTLQAFSGIFLSFTLYYIAKKVTQYSRMYIVSLGIFLSILAAFLFGNLFSALGVICYFMINAFAGGFRWTAINPFHFDAIEGEEKFHSQHRYAYIFDQQLMLNLGRNTSLLLFLLLLCMLGKQTVIRLAPFLFALPQLVIVWIMGSVEKSIIKDDIKEKAVVYNYIQAIYKD